jgi:hypothetical protein
MGREIWYRATIYGGEPEAFEVVKRNEKRIWVKARKGVAQACIVTRWAQYFPTLEEAMRYIAVHKLANQADRAAEHLFAACRRQAPKLYEALELILADKGNLLTFESQLMGMAALAAAKGETPCHSST